MMGALLLQLLIASLHSAMAQGVPKSPEMLWMRGRHDNVVFAVAVSPDGNTLASVGADDTLRLWRMSDQSLLRTIYVPDNGNLPRSVAFSRDSQYIFTGSGANDYRIRQWRRADGVLVRTFPNSDGHTAGITYLAVSPDGATLASASVDHTVILWDIATGAALTVLAGANGHTSVVNQVAFSPDSKELASAGSDSEVKIWKLVNGGWAWQRNLTQTAPVLSVAWSGGTGKYVASGSGNSEFAVTTWNSATGSKLSSTKAPISASVQAVAFSSNGKYLAIGEAGNPGIGTLYTVSPTGGLTYLREVAGHGANINSLVFNPGNANQIVTGSDDCTSSLWDIRFVDSNLGVFTGHQANVNAVAVAPNALIVASSSGNPENAIRLWSISDGAPLGVIGRRDVGGTTSSYHFDAVNSVSFSPDSTLLASGSTDSTVRFWDVTHPLQIVAKYQPFNTSSPLQCVAFSPDGAQLAAGCNDGTIHRYNVQAGTEIKPTLSDNSGNVYCLAYSPDGSQLASGSADYKVRVWNVANGSVTGRYSGHTSYVFGIAWSPDGTQLASSGYNTDNTVRLWNTVTWTSSIILTFGTSVHGLSFSPDGTNVVAGSDDQTVQVFNITKGLITYYSSDTCAGVHSIACAPGGNTFAYGGDNGVVGLAIMPGMDIPAQITSVATESSTLIGGNWTVGTVTIQSAVANDVTVDLATNPSDEVFTDSSVIIPAGATSATFYVGSLPVVSTTPIILYATLDGVTRSVNLSVAPTMLATLTLSPTSVKGGQTAAGTVQLSGPAPEGGITVQLSSDSVAATVPATVHLPAGYSSATFALPTSAVKANTTANISAKLNSTVMTAKLTITP
jgi:WD40 repeat protein